MIINNSTLTGVIFILKFKRSERMSISKTTLLQTIQLSDGELYATTNNRRCLLSTTVPVLEVYENETTVPILGKGRQIKKMSYSLVLCKDSEFTREVDLEYLQSVTAFDLTAQVQRTDGVFEVITFNNIEPESIQTGGDWVFNAPVTERMKELFNIHP